jgi:hypothetical protein
MSDSNGGRAWAIGGLVLAATLMIMLGLWQIFVGIAAIVDDAFFVAGPNYTYELSTTGWGWIHLILGVVTVAAGMGLFSAATWARVLGILLAILVAVNNFLFLPYYPVWSIVIIALAVFVIWSLATTSRRDLDTDTTTGRTAYR